MKIGYARVSTADQRIDLQLDALEKAECERVFQDVASGGNLERAALDEAIAYAREGDTLVVWRLDRLGRSVRDLVNLVNDLQEQGVQFSSIVDGIDTTTPAGQFFFHITAAFAELERNLIRERTRAGLESARARGRMGGRPKAIDPKTFELARDLYEANSGTVAEICERLGIATRTFYRYLKNERDAAVEHTEVVS